MKKATLILLFISFSLFGFPQIVSEKGYIITLKDDTIKGEIKHNLKKDVDLYSKITFSVSEKDKKMYNATKIKEYNMNGQTFISRGPADERFFLRRVVQGIINVCEFKYEEEGEIYSDYYIQRSTDQDYVQLSDKKFKKQLSELMFDNKDILAELADKKFEFENSIELIQKYNDQKKKKGCLPKSDPLIRGEQLNSFAMTAGQKVLLKMIFYSGQNYRLNICVPEVLGEVNYKLLDAKKKVIFNSLENGNPDHWDFNFKTTQQLFVEVEAPPRLTKSKETPSDYVSLSVGYLTPN